jgi:hypothetical protein
VPVPASTSPSLDSARTAHTTPAADPTKNDDDDDGRASTTHPKAAPNKLSRRERILHLARQNARTPLPEAFEEPKPPAEAAEKNGVADGESERRMKERTIRERLWRLVGGNY